MEKVTFRTLSKAVDYYTNLGYTFPFDFSAGNESSAGWAIVATHRFEGFSDPADNSVLFILEDKSHQDKGLFIDAYGAARNEFMNQFLQKIPRYFPTWLILPEVLL